MVSPRQRAANRANARKSTGPKTSWGRSRASINSTKHALTQKIDTSPWGEHLGPLTKLLILEGLDAAKAHELARKILDYERNLLHLRKKFLDSREGRGLDYQTPTGAILDIYLAGELDKAGKNKKPVFEEKLDQELAKFFRQIAIKEMKDAKRKAEMELRNTDRYFRRAANQLIKSLRDLA